MALYFSFSNVPGKMQARFLWFFRLSHNESNLKFEAKPQTAVISLRTRSESTYTMSQQSLMHSNFHFTDTHSESPHQAVSQLSPNIRVCEVCALVESPPPPSDRGCPS